MPVCERHSEIRGCRCVPGMDPGDSGQRAFGHSPVLLGTGREVDVRVPGSLIQRASDDRWPPRVDETRIYGRANGEATMIDTGFNLSAGAGAAKSNIAEVNHVPTPNSETLV